MSGQVRPAGGAGWSAAVKAQEVRAAGRGGLLRQFLRLLGLDPQAARVEAEARAWESGAIGEQMTAGLLEALEVAGWRVFHDRALPTGRANFDHVLIPPAADLLLLVDSKLWSKRKGTVNRSARGKLQHDTKDCEWAATALRYEARVLRERLRTDVIAVMCVHSAPVAGGRFSLEGIIVVQGDGLLEVLRQYQGRSNPRAFARLVRAAEAALPPYVAPVAR